MRVGILELYNNTMQDYWNRSECEFGMLSRNIWEERRPPVKWAIEKDQRINDEVSELLRGVPAEYRRDVGARVRRIILILKG